MKKANSHKAKGFTLIELIIIIAILSIIAVIIIPKFISVKESSAEGVNNYNMHVVQEELEHYRAKNDKFYVA